MSFLKHDQSLELDAAQNIARVRFVVGKMTTSLGFDYWHYERSSYENYARPENTVLGNLPAAWEKRERMLEPSRLGVEMSKVRFNNSHLPSAHIWGLTDAQTIPPALASNEAPLVPIENITTSGWSQVVRGGDGASLGMFSLVREDKALSHKEILKKQTDVYWLAYALHDKVTKFQAIPLRISMVEREIMRWTADGKSTADIASILQMKERTVTFRINNVVTRLGVQNKTAAAVRLAVGGMLF